jgi:hypothetical protein
MKDQLKLELKNLLFDQKFVLTAFEGGSKATGFMDDYSDLDLLIISEDNAVEQVFILVESFLSEKYGIKRKYRVPEPTWHGFSQSFYQIDHMPPFFYIDLAVAKLSTPDKFTDTARHGQGFVWFDKHSDYKVILETDDQVYQRCKKYYHMVTESDFLIQIEIEKNIQRGRYSEAFPFYYQFITRQLGVMLNLKHRKNKVDFGIRYHYRDYDSFDQQLINTCLKSKDIQDLKENYALAKQRYEALKIEFKTLYK